MNPEDHQDFNKTSLSHHSLLTRVTIGKSIPNISNQSAGFSVQIHAINALITLFQSLDLAAANNIQVYISVPIKSPVFSIIA